MSETARDSASERGEPDDDACSQTGCSRSGVVERRLTGSDYVGSYCDRHDPLEDPSVAKEFEAVEDDQGGSA